MAAGEEEIAVETSSIDPDETAKPENDVLTKIKKIIIIDAHLSSPLPHFFVP